MTLPAAPTLDMTLASCPLCQHEQVELLGEAQANHTMYSLHCTHCGQTQRLGWVGTHSRYLSPQVLMRWGVAL
ncbi:hypothetical protein E7T09_04580 [Deinococcus sp. KSM4-11]|uniref:hypothetical protein n=1 Tax=Deinococcus sp. KSM4-11 TaxID=2568654 RepID=UPI0010A49759|nr:hypothetical protein [Deinococcus sp. KSM4-11]THF88487.1 hypothetical protein E7T09_04580 [Deinococcus sp. KSM4-11]